MEIKAVGKYLRMSPRKVRLVVDKIRGKNVNEASAILDYSSKAAAAVVKKILRSAVANAENNFKVEDIEKLVVSTAWVDEGPTVKRLQPMSMGRGGRIRKRTSHVTIVLDEKA
jgi:large subunit ribosomal protein L22